MLSPFLVFVDNRLEDAFWASPLVHASLQRYNKTAAVVQLYFVAVALHALFRDIFSDDPLPLWRIGKHMLSTLSCAVLLLIWINSQSELRVIRFRNMNFIVCHRAACLIAIYFFPMPQLGQLPMLLAESSGISSLLPPWASIMSDVYLLFRALLIRTGVAAVWCIFLLWPLRFREHLMYHCACIPALIWRSYDVLSVVRNDARLSAAACVVYRALNFFLVLPVGDAAMQDELSNCPVETLRIIVWWFVFVFGIFSPPIFLYMVESGMRLGFVHVDPLYYRPMHARGARPALAYEFANYICHVAMLSVFALNVVYVGVFSG